MIKSLSTINILSWNDLEELNQEKSSAILVKNFYSQKNLEKYCQFLENFPVFMGKLDSNFYQTALQSTSGHKKYRANASEIETILEYTDSICGHNFFQHIVKAFETSLKQKIKRLALDGFGRLSKIAIHGWRDIMIPLHHDRIAEELPSSQKAQECLSQFACNVYMNSNFTGGDLIVYNRKLKQSDIEACLSNKVRRHEIGLENGTRISPECGDLVIISSERVHEVTPIQGKRVSASFFLGKFKNDKHLRMWA